jgi:hypothetical protein
MRADIIAVEMVDRSKEETLIATYTLDLFAGGLPTLKATAFIFFTSLI